MYINKLHLWTSRPKQCWEVLCNSNLVSQLGKGPGHHVCSMVSLQNCSLGAPTYNPRPQTDVISLHGEMQLWFYYNIFTMLFVSPCES